MSDVKGVIRPVKRRDWEEIYKIEKLCFKDAYPKVLLQYLATLHGDTFLVYEVNGEVVGYAVGAHKRNGEGHVLSIAVHPELRGKGVVKALSWIKVYSFAFPRKTKLRR